MAYGQAETHHQVLHMLLQVVLWEVDRHQLLLPKASTTEKGCTITHTAIASRALGGSGGQQSNAAAYYAISAPGSGTVTIKWLDEQGRTGVVQVSRQDEEYAMPLPSAAAPADDAVRAVWLPQGTLVGHRCKPRRCMHCAVLCCLLP
jgi:hypothetical protein